MCLFEGDELEKPECTPTGTHQTTAEDEIRQGEKEDSTEPCEAEAGTLAMEEDYMKQGYPDVVRQQHTSNVAASQSADKKRSDSGPNCCMQCCMKTKNCLMSPECGRALSIASVISMCGMCIRMWTCQSRQHEQQTMAPLKVNEMLPQSTVKKLNVRMDSACKLWHMLLHCSCHAVVV
ncbi:hypothetical protein AOLI_G00167960 [Acnodon oligacanthus]